MSQVKPYIDDTPFALMLFFYLLIMGLVGLFTWATFKAKKVTPWVIFCRGLGIVTLSFSTLWILSEAFPHSNLKEVVLTLSLFLLPLSWILGSLGITYYGWSSLKSGKTYIKSTAKSIVFVNGFPARYLGILWILCGIFMILIFLVPLSHTLCPNGSGNCLISNISDNILAIITKTFMIISKPLNWFGIIN